MSTISKPRRPRITTITRTAVGTLVFSTNKSTKNALKVLKRIDQEVQVCFNPVSYNSTNYKFIPV